MPRRRKAATKDAPPKDSGPKIVPIPCTSFNKLIKECEKRLHFTKELRDTFSFMLAIVVSLELKGEQLWARIIGPPGSGKTTLAELISAARDRVFPISTLTGFHSGFVDNDDKDKDNAILAQMHNKVSIIKDGDTLLQAMGRDRILAEMRDFYDGVSRARYRNNVTHEYEELNVPFIICGTDSLRQLNRTDVGERFLDCEIIGDGDRNPFVERAITNMYEDMVASMNTKLGEDNDEIDPEDANYLKRLTVGYIEYLSNHVLKRAIPVLSQEGAHAIKCMANFLAMVRARHKKDKETGDLHRTRVEIPTRLGKQFTKAAFCLAIIMEERRMDGSVLEVVRKIMLDTAESTELEVVQSLRAARSKGMSMTALASITHTATTSMNRRLQSMSRFGIVENGKKPNNSGQAGRDLHVWKLTPRMSEYCEGAFS